MAAAWDVVIVQGLPVVNAFASSISGTVGVVGCVVLSGWGQMLQKLELWYIYEKTLKIISIPIQLKALQIFKIRFEGECI